MKINFCIFIYAWYVFFENYHNFSNNRMFIDKNKILLEYSKLFVFQRVFSSSENKILTNFDFWNFF